MKGALCRCSYGRVLQVPWSWDQSAAWLLFEITCGAGLLLCLRLLGLGGAAGPFSRVGAQPTPVQEGPRVLSPQTCLPGGFSCMVPL